MPKFDEQNHVLALFSAAQTLTDELFLLFGKKNPQFVGEIADSYTKRAQVLEAIDKWRRVNADEFGYADFASRWQTASAKLEKQDAQLMQEIPAMSRHLQEKLVDLNKRKFLLIYSRGQST